jgi:methionyl-tRNA formyltransferase
MRIVFMGSPDFAVPSLNALVEAGHEVVAIYAQPPRPAGRGKAERKTAVHERAEQLGIEVRTPRTLRDPDEQARFRALDADFGVVAAYGLILPKPILEAPKGGCINVHASLLPRWRGAAPIQRAILAGDKETGITIMQMEEGLDTGPILLIESTQCLGRSAAILETELAKLGAKLLQRYLKNPSAYLPMPQPQDGVTYASKVQKEEYRIDFRNSAQFIDRQIDAFNPPGAYFECRGERIRILRAEWDWGPGTPGEVIFLDGDVRIVCGEDAIIPRELQRAGRSPMHARAFFRGFQIPIGSVLQ